MSPRKSWWWVPVRLTSSGYIRVEASSGEDAIQVVETQDFNPDEAIGHQVESVEVTGPPQIQEVT